MKLKVLKVKESDKDVLFKIQLDALEFTKQCEKTQKEVAKNYKIPGFRKGFIPKAVLAKHISPEEIKNYCLSSDNFQNALIDSIIATKEFEKSKSIQFLNSLKVIDLNDTNGPIVEAIFDSMPIITNLDTLDFKKITLPKFKETKKTAEDIKRNLKPLLKREAVIVAKQNKVIENHDVAVIDFKGFIDDKPFAGGEAKNYELEIGSKSFIGDFEQQLIGLKPNDKKNVIVTFPKDYHAKNYAGKKAKFEVLVHDVKTISYPKIDKKFINETLKINQPDVDNEQKLIAFLQTLEHENAYSTYQDQCFKIIIDTLSKQVKISHESEGLTNYYVNNLIHVYEKQLQQQGFQSLQQYITISSKNDKDFGQKFNQEIKRQASLQLVGTLIFNAMIEKLKIECTKQDLNDFFKKHLSLSSTSSDQLKKEFNKKENETYYQNIVLKSKLFNKITTLCKLEN